MRTKKLKPGTRKAFCPSIIDTRHYVPSVWVRTGHLKCVEEDEHIIFFGNEPYNYFTPDSEINYLIDRYVPRLPAANTVLLLELVESHTTKLFRNVTIHLWKPVLP